MNAPQQSTPSLPAQGSPSIASSPAIDEGIKSSVEDSSKLLAPIGALAAVQSSPESSEDNSIHEFVHQYLRDYISLADQKAAFIFAAVSAILAFLAGKDVFQPLTSTLALAALTWHGAIGILAATTLTASGLLAIAVVTPRLTHRAPEKTGVIYWGDILSHGGPRDYASSLSKLDTKHAAEQVRLHCFVLAHVCNGKYRVLTWAIWTGTCGFLFSVVFMVFK